VVKAKKHILTSDGTCCSSYSAINDVYNVTVHTNIHYLLQLD